MSVLGCLSLHSLPQQPACRNQKLFSHEDWDAYMCEHKINCHRDCLYGRAGEQLPLKQKLANERLMCLTPSRRAADADDTATMGRKVSRRRHLSNAGGLRCFHLNPVSALVPMPGSLPSALCVP